MDRIIYADGGIGRVLCLTPAIRKLKERNPDDRIVVVTAWRDVFLNNPNVSKIYPFDHSYLWDDVVRLGRLYNPEPYHDYEYYTQKHHIAQSFDRIINGSTEAMNGLFPEIYLSPELLQFGKELVEHIKKESGKERVIAFQPFGASGCGGRDFVADPSCRSLSAHTAKRMADAASDWGMMFSCTHIDLDHTNIWKRDSSLLELFAIVAACDYVITIDSSLAHIGAAFRKPGIQLLGGTFAENVGYPDLYRTIIREGYPKSFTPNRIHGGVELNQDAMSFNEEELECLLTMIRTKDFLTTPKEEVKKTFDYSSHEGVYLQSDEAQQSLHLVDNSET